MHIHLHIHTHTNTHTHARTHTNTISLALSVSLSLWHVHIYTHKYTHMYPHTYTHAQHTYPHIGGRNSNGNNKRPVAGNQKKSPRALHVLVHSRKKVSLLLPPGWRGPDWIFSRHMVKTTQTSPPCTSLLLSTNILVYSRVFWITITNLVILYHFQLSMASFRFCETYLLHIQLFVDKERFCQGPGKGGFRNADGKNSASRVVCDFSMLHFCKDEAWYLAVCNCIQYLI